MGNILDLDPELIKHWYIVAGMLGIYTIAQIIVYRHHKKLKNQE